MGGFYTPYFGAGEAGAKVGTYFVERARAQQITTNLVFKIWQLWCESCTHSVGEFCTLLEAANCHIMEQIVFVSVSAGWGYLSYIPPIHPFRGAPLLSLSM